MDKKTRVGVAAALLALESFAALPAYDTLIAHRGESVDAPENTLPAYRMAVERGFGFECDIYLSKDGRVFTFHDRNLKRTTDGANTNRCAGATWAELENVDVGNWGKWKGSKFKGTRPALLEEVLALARDGRQIYIEVKTGPEIVPHVKIGSLPFFPPSLCRLPNQLRLCGLHGVHKMKTKKKGCENKFS